jgi:osmotically-inducible protein OsmY
VKFILLALTLLACGCSGSGNGTRTEEDRIDDHAIEADVNRAISRVDGVDRLRVRIESIRGIVTLSGKVRDEAAAKGALEAAAKVSGVKKVTDALEREGQ